MTEGWKERKGRTCWVSEVLVSEILVPVEVVPERTRPTIRPDCRRRPEMGPVKFCDNGDKETIRDSRFQSYVVKRTNKPKTYIPELSVSPKRL